MVIFLFFLCLSAFFWFLNALKNEYTTEILYPVEYSNFPSNKVLIKKLPDEFKLKVKSHGYTLLRNMFNKSINPIIIDVNTIYENRQKNKFSILTSNAKREISSQLLRDISVIDIMPDTLFFEFSNMIGKKLPVKPNLKLLYTKQYYQSGKILLSPDSVFVSGPKSILDTLKFIETEKIVVEGLEKSIDEEIGLFKTNDLIFTDKSINIIIPVDKYTESSFIVPIEVKNKPKNVTIITYPKDIRVKFLVSLSNFKKLKPYHIKATVDYNDIESNLSNKLKVTVEYDTIEFYLYSIKTMPSLVEYIIEN